MATLVQTPASVSGLSRLKSLPFTLDLSCPLSLPSKPLNAGTDWPYEIAGPSTLPREFNDEFIQRRYYETLYLSEGSVGVYGIVQLVKPLLLSLPQIEKRHRKLILPLLSSSQAASTIDEISQIERNVIGFALDLRVGSRQAVEDGIIPSPKKLSDELEKREILIQIILLLLYTTFTTETEASNKKRKRSKSSRREAEQDQPTIVNPAEDPKVAMELLMDRLSVWQAVAELGLPLGDPTDVRNIKGKGKVPENVIANMLGRFWKSVILPYFMTKQPDLCSIFHQKVFGHPIPPKLVPASLHTQNQNQTKKPRKPKLTHPILSKSSDPLLPPPPISRDRPRSVSGESVERRQISGTGSRAPSETGSTFSRNSPPRDDINFSTKRNLTRTSTTNDAINPFRRSRSKSIDPNPSNGDKFSRTASSSLALNNKKGLTRNQSSGKDLFKGREVGMIRRTASKKLEREDSLSRTQSGRFGLLGRKTSGGKENSRRGSMEESQKQNTLILATPSKPRSQSQFFRPSHSHSQPSWIPPTPIREEPSSTPRPSYIAETPMTNRIAHTDTLPLGGIGTRDEDDEMESDDPLGELWELTDDDDEGDDPVIGKTMIPETPMK
ncbi:uncharacterized protein I206_106416 [Kwoniella pini CBS 10737]|uniref:DNA replication regulator Sld3 C-terminal domain-containing protein n=1 Tax=Kwoniella pini CBS 10737 TaxID=1296096 RepID=A0AAJ8MSN4_9TREE